MGWTKQLWARLRGGRKGMPAYIWWVEQSPTGLRFFTVPGAPKLQITRVNATRYRVRLELEDR
jgi:hypothetical protein